VLSAGCVRLEAALSRLRHTDPMRATDARPDLLSLSAAARRCVQLLYSSAFDELAQSFGYAVALGREPSEAIASDLARSLREVGAAALVAEAEPQTRLTEFAPGQDLRAVVEIELVTDGDHRVLVELVATESEGRTRVTLEQISASGTHSQG